MKNKIITLLFILFSSLGFSQLSKTHYIPPITSGPSNANPQDQYLYISTPNNGDVNVTINIIGSNSESQVISKDNPWIYTISQDGYSSLVQDPSSTGQVTNNRGFIIESDSPIYVSARLNAGGAQAGALVSKGENALGTIFRAGTYDNQGSVSSNYMNFFSFMATEDNTSVNLTNNLTNGFEFEHSNEQFPINNIILNRGESYVLAARADKASANRAGLIGTLISSDKPIVVNTGSANGSFGTGGARDYGIDQIVDLSKVGKEYVFVKGNGENSYENVLVVVHEDNTEIFVNGDSKVTRNGGEYYIVEGDQFINNNMYVNTSKDTFVYQGIGGTTSEANQGMFFVPPLSCGSRGDVDNIPQIDKIGTLTFTGGITIVTKENSEVLINGDDLSSQPGSVNVTGPTSVTAKNAYVTYKVTGLTGNVSVSSSDELYVSYFNFNGAAASGSFFSGFASNPSLDLNLSASKLGSCINESGTSNVVLNVSNNGNFDSVQWEKKNNDNTWSQISGEINSEFTPTEIGSYRVKGIIACDGTVVEYYSSEIPISQCPDDFDGDGIINNVDLDQDNDGILNSVESRGIGNIDFSNTASPTIRLSDGTAINEVISGLVSGDGSLTGSNQSFEMQVEAGVDQELKYALTFSENININVKDNPNVSVAIRNGESFIIKSSPASSNITLLDPNNNLLVDTNFDDEFENNVTEFTSNEIRFKFNTNSTATIDYELFATKIDGVTFTHKYSTTETGESVFVPNVYVYDYKNDSDGDGNEDMFERDSDNDGCDDVIEADFTALENYQGDPDNDGIYGTGAQTFDNGLVDDRGRIKMHFDNGGYDKDPKKDSNDNYLFQTVGSPAVIQTQPQSTSGCEGSIVEFEVSATSESGAIQYQWQFYNLTNETWDDLEDTGAYSGTKTEKLTLSSITTEMDGRYRVLVNSEFYLCETESDGNVNLQVISSPDPPIVSPIQTFCFTDSPTVGDLIIDPSNPAGLTIQIFDDYDPNDASVGNELDTTVALIDGQKYYIQVTNSDGCVSVAKSETKVLLSNPVLTASIAESCPGDEITITVSGVPQTALDFELANPTLTKILSDHVNDEGRISTYFVDPTARTFTQAEDLLPSYGTGTSMYQINDLNEHDAVWNAIVEKNLNGQVPLWLGLKQIPASNPNQEFDEGWYWLDGRELDSSWSLWQNGEPNDQDSDGIDDGKEDYGHFNLAGAGKFLNDCPEELESKPLYEFSGTTTIKWYYEDPSNPGTFIDIPINASTLTLSPEVTTTYFIDVTTNGIVCSTSITHTVNPFPEINAIPDYVFCDDESDGDANNGSITLQEDDFNVLRQSILGQNQNVADFTFTYHVSDENAQNGEDAISFPYTTPSKETTALHWENISTEIYVRVVNNTTGCVTSGKAFDLVVNTLPITFEVDDILICDDDYDGVVTGFNLEFRSGELRSGNETTDPNDIDNQSPDNFPITYHLSLDDANDLNSSGITSPYESGNATIYYRIQKMTNDGQLVCFKTGEAFNLIVKPLPIIKTEFVNIEQCDDGKGSENDGVTLHNLTESQSLFSDNYENEVFEYYKDLDLTQKIENPTAYENEAFNDKVYFKITTQDGCEMTSKSPSGSDRLVINIRVGASEISETFIEDNNTLYSVCEDSDALSQDGLSVFSSSVLQEINTKLINSNPKFADQNIKVTLHRNSTDGLTGENPINLNEDFTSSTPYTQEIWARIVNIDITEFTCLGYAKVGELYVESKPIAYPVTIEKQCDGDSPLDLDSQDGIYPFDVSLIEEQVINGQTDATVTYFNEDGTQIENFGPVFETASQTITIRVERDPSYPDISNPDGLCYDQTTLEFVVNDSPEAYPVVLDAHCDGDDGASDTDGYDIFDTSNVILTLTTNPETGVSQDVSKLNIKFTYVDEFGVVKTDDKLPNPFNTKTQTVNVTIENPLNLNCIINEEIDFIVNPLPSFDIDDETIVCLNPLPDNPIEVGTFNWNGANDPTIYNYNWSRTDLNGLDDTSFNETTETIKVDKGGVYTVIVEDAVTLCTRSKSITVTESEIATISLDDITIEDLKNDDTNTVTIDTLNLGIGDYEFSLDEPFGPYQDEPIFESVKPGIHTLYIRDKNSYYTYDYGCGIAQIDISVIGYRKYFTPNGDGINETWKILGIRSDFNANSNVYIFDRFGKLIKELDPLTDGWDGTYLGKPMPATDYWFRTYLEDGREFKGHFSLIRGN